MFRGDTRNPWDRAEQFYDEPRPPRKRRAFRHQRAVWAREKVVGCRREKWHRIGRLTITDHDAEERAQAAEQILARFVSDQLERAIEEITEESGKAPDGKQIERMRAELQKHADQNRDQILKEEW